MPYHKLPSALNKWYLPRGGQWCSHQLRYIFLDINYLLATLFTCNNVRYFYNLNNEAKPKPSTSQSDVMIILGYTKSTKLAYHCRLWGCGFVYMGGEFKKLKTIPIHLHLLLVSWKKPNVDKFRLILTNAPLMKPWGQSDGFMSDSTSIATHKWFSLTYI